MLSVMQFFPKVLFTDLFFFVFQYLQRTCDIHTQCDAITLEKNFAYLLSLLLQFLQSTCERHTQCDAIFPKSTIHRPVLFPNSVPTEDMRTSYSVWCNFSQKVLFTDLFFFVFQYLQRTCNSHTHCDAITLEKSLRYLLFLLLQFLQSTCERHT